MYTCVCMRELDPVSDHTFIQCLLKGSLEKPLIPSSWFSLNLLALRLVKSNCSQRAVDKVDVFFYPYIALSGEDF